MSQIKYILTGLVSFYALIVKEEQLAELEDEYQRKGDYIRLWPSVKHCDKFGILESPNYSDILVMEWISLCKGDGDAKRLLKLEQAHHTTKVVKMPSQDTIIN